MEKGAGWVEEWGRRSALQVHSFRCHLERIEICGFYFLFIQHMYKGHLHFIYRYTYIGIFEFTYHMVIHSFYNEDISNKVVVGSVSMWHTCESNIPESKDNVLYLKGGFHLNAMTY